MTKDFIFWFLMFLILIFGFFSTWPWVDRPSGYRGGFNLILFVILFIIGLALFGSPIK